MAYPLFGKCPACDEPLEATRLYCRHCDTSIDGHFDLGRLYHLSPEQLAFVVTFVRCEGKITRMEDELGISYPTVRNRLNEVIRALGYEIDESSVLSEDERRAILQQVADGEISSDAAIRLLAAQ